MKNKESLSEEFKKAVKKEFTSFTGTVKLELSQGGISDAYLKIKLK